MTERLKSGLCCTAYTLMPAHVHVAFSLLGAQEASDELSTWKLVYFLP